MKKIYLDHMSTTPCDPRVIEEMMPFLTEHFGNPHSKDHAWGWAAEEAIETARTQIAQILGAQPKEIVFTSGATEASNLAIRGLAAAHPEKKHIITTQIEHKCVLDTCRWLQQNQGYEITYCPVQPNGVLDTEHIKSALREDTLLVAVMAANNEIGTLQPIKEVGAICKENGTFFFTDAAQAFAKVPIDVNEFNIDLMAISGHKIHGPKGVGALFVRKSGRRARLTPIITGGNQEKGLRSGTLPTFLCVGLAAAARLTWECRTADATRFANMKEKLLETLTALPHAYVNGALEHALPHILNISFSDVEGEGLMGHVSNIAVSSGSACTSESLEPSYVLKALGVDDTLAHTSLRISFGRFTTEEEVVEAAQQIADAVTHLRKMSPLWEMRNAGIDISKVQWKHH